MSTGLRTETRLEEHRRLFETNEGVGPMLRIEELSAEELELVNADFIERCRGRAEDLDAIYVAYARTLHSWGLICPHPQLHRRYDGFHKTDIPVSFAECRWYSCLLCDTIVINR